MKTVVEYLGPDDPIDDEELPEFDRIVTDPKMLGGKPTIRGHRISVQFVLERLSTGESIDSFAACYKLDREDVTQAILFAASRMTKHLSTEVACHS